MKVAKLNQSQQSYLWVCDWSKKSKAENPQHWTTDDPKHFQCHGEHFISDRDQESNSQTKQSVNNHWKKLLFQSIFECEFKQKRCNFSEEPHIEQNLWSRSRKIWSNKVYQGTGGSVAIWNITDGNIFMDFKKFCTKRSQKLYFFLKITTIIWGKQSKVFQ